jgi:hypothetical protein
MVLSTLLKLAPFLFHVIRTSTPFEEDTTFSPPPPLLSSNVRAITVNCRQVSLI